jgi:hypothetical protein
MGIRVKHSHAVCADLRLHAPLLAPLLPRHLILGTEIPDGSLLLSVHDAGEDGEEELPRLKDRRFHR